MKLNADEKLYMHKEVLAKEKVDAIDISGSSMGLKGMTYAAEFLWV
ncbi:MAG: hypothetical protein WDA24_00745 [Tissierellales bacterium]